MRSHYQRVASDHLQRRVHLWEFGDRGQPIIVFPSAAGMAHEWQASRAVDALAPLIDAGRIRLICPESNVSRAWTGDGAPDERLDLHRAYERFVAEELIPRVLSECPDHERVATTGCSFGSFYAANLALKNPELVEWALCISGRYRTEAFLDGFYDDRVYFSDPLHYVPNLEGEWLNRVRQTALTLVVGLGGHEGRCLDETLDLARVLAGKGIPHFRDLEPKGAHHWNSWRTQIVRHIHKHYGR